MVNPNKHVLIVENNTNGLTLNESVKVEKDKNGNRIYRLSGIFTEFDVTNRNDRVYTSDKFLPHLNELVERKNTLGAVYGEFDHPDVFDTSLQRISHTIEKVYFNQNENRVDGEIRLLNTRWGKEAKALVEDNCPIFVSSRAAGITESDGTVTVKKLFTYDCVADPGFGSARMEVMNESLGFNTQNTNFRIFDVSDESKINELFKMNQNDFVTKTQMVEYSEYLKEEVENVKSVLDKSIKDGNVPSEDIMKMSENYENLMETQNKVSKYLDYLAETIQVVVNENKSLQETTTKLSSHNDYLAENLEKSIKYSEYLAEKLDKNINYSEYIAETLDKNIDFSEYIAEHVNKNIQFSDYLAENIEKSIDYGEYIAENLDKNIAYSEYIAENLDKNIAYSEYIAENVDSSIAYSEYLAENIDNNIAYSEYIAENVDNNIAYAEYIAEHVDNNIAYSEYIAENVSDGQAYMNYIAEGLDNTMEVLKENKLFEQGQQMQVPTMRQVDDVEKYYDEDDDFVQRPQGQAQTIQTQVQEPVQGAQEGQPVQGEVVQEPVQGEVPVQGQPIEGQPIEGQPVQGEVPVQGIEGGMVQEPIDAEGNPFDAQTIEGQPVQGMPDSVEGQPMGAQVQFVQGAQVSVEDRTGEILAANPENNLYVIKMTDNNEIQEVHESKVTLIGDKIMETEDSLKSYIGNLITETKKRKASETKDPHFVQFLTEKNKQAWHGLSTEDKEQVVFSINESKEQIYTEVQVLHAITKSLSVQKSFDDVLLEGMPSSLKPIWETLNENYKKSIISTAKLYPSLDNETKIEKFWESRRLESYTQINENKQILNENRVVDNTSLTDDQIDSFISKINNLGY